MRLRSLLGGDWNESPDSTGDYSPRWIAEQTGMRITAPVAGPHGRIDFVMSDAWVDFMHRVPGGLSDHGLIVFDVYSHRPQQGAPAPARLRGAIWNAERDRSAEDTRRMVSFLQAKAQREHVDFFLLQECKQYHPALRLVRGFKLYAASTPQGARHSVILVRRDIGVTDVKIPQLSRRGWLLRGWGGDNEHAPTYTPFATLNGWLRVTSIHEPPAVDWKRGRIIGALDRRRARKQSARRLVARTLRNQRTEARLPD